MANTWTATDLLKQWRRIKANAILPAAKESAAAFKLDLAVWLAVGSRETNLRNIVGDGGHGRGPWQLDGRYHGIPETLPELARASAVVLAANLTRARGFGLSGRSAAKVALSAYNCGFSRAWKGHLLGDSDTHTTGADYGFDVLARAEVFRDLLG